MVPLMLLHRVVGVLVVVIVVVVIVVVVVVVVVVVIVRRNTLLESSTAWVLLSETVFWKVIPFWYYFQKQGF